jgi:hypothetical protein
VGARTAARRTRGRRFRDVGLLAHRPLTLPIGKVLFAVLATFGAAIMVFALSTHLILSLAVLAVMGAADVVSVVIRFALVQLRTPAEMPAPWRQPSAPCPPC